MRAVRTKERRDESKCQRSLEPERRSLLDCRHSQTFARTRAMRPTPQQSHRTKNCAVAAWLTRLSAPFFRYSEKIAQIPAGNLTAQDNTWHVVPGNFADSGNDNQKA